MRGQYFVKMKLKGIIYDWYFSAASGIWANSDRKLLQEQEVFMLSSNGEKVRNSDSSDIQHSVEMFKVTDGIEFY